MKSSRFSLLVVGVLLTAIAFADDAKDKDEAIKKDRERIEGDFSIRCGRIW